MLGFWQRSVPRTSQIQTRTNHPIALFELSDSYMRIYPIHTHARTHEGVSKSFRTGHLEQELQMIQLSATRCCCITILWVSLVSFATITLCVASQ
jgi:hypothetical protein